MRTWIALASGVNGQAMPGWRLTNLRLELVPRRHGARATWLTKPLQTNVRYLEIGGFGVVSAGQTDGDFK
jgi:hypothetical protein